MQALIAEATVGAYNESKQRMGFYTIVVVERVDLADDDQIVAICRRGRSTQAVPILELPLPTPRPAGAQWIDAYRLRCRPR